MKILAPVWVNYEGSITSQFLCISLLPFMKSQQSITYYRNMLAFVLVFFLHKCGQRVLFLGDIKWYRSETMGVYNIPRKIEAQQEQCVQVQLIFRSQVLQRHSSWVASTLHTIVAVKAGEVPPMKNQFWMSTGSNGQQLGILWTFNVALPSVSVQTN